MQYTVVIFFYYCEMQGILCGKEVVFRVDIQINNGYSVRKKNKGRSPET